MKKNFVKSRWLFTMLLFVTTMIMPTMMLAQSITPTKPKGDGKAEPYQISNAAELYWFAGLVNGTLPEGGETGFICQCNPHGKHYREHGRS